MDFKTISGGTNISITTNSNYIGINFTGSSGGGTITGGTNGLSTSGANIVLGGALTGTTNICAINGTSLTFTDLRTTAVGIQYGGDYSTNQTCLSIPNVGWVTGGTGGFRGTVTKSTATPSDLRNNQWVKPEPMSTDCFAYTFDNFTDSGATAISVNLSLEDVYLRYDKINSYWVKESYEKPLSSGTTWVGGDTCKAEEVAVINEWVNSPTDINYTGQKYSYPTQTIFQVDVGTCITIPNKILVETIDLGTVANTCIFTIPACCCALVSSAKLIMLQTANPDSVSVSIGNNSCSEIPSQSYWNMVCTCQIDDVTLRDVYDLLTPTVATGAAICNGGCCGADVYFRVQSGSTGTLCAHLLFEGFIF